MPWVYVALTQMIDFHVDMAKKNPNIETKQCAYHENVDEASQNGQCVPTSHLPTNRL